MGMHYFSYFWSKNIDCEYSLEPPRRGGSNEYPQSMFWSEIWKLSFFLSENFQFLQVQFSIYLYRHVFVMMEKKELRWSKVSRKPYPDNEGLDQSTYLRTISIWPGHEQFTQLIPCKLFMPFV